jgi:hypothetical protein
MIVGFIGYKGCGKSTAARLLVERHGFIRTRFAEPLKKMLLALGCTPDEVDGDLKETPCAALNGRTPRHAMQTLGTEWGREMISQTLWLDAWCRAVEGVDRVVVDDCRFPNEASLIRERGGIIVEVKRDGAGDGRDGHASEAYVSAMRPEIILSNNGSIEELAANLWLIGEMRCP